MQGSFTSNQWSDDSGSPAGGCTFGTGFCISWQNGPLNRDEERLDPNGAFVETIIAVALDRLEFYQQSKFISEYNANAIAALSEALGHLNARTADREERAVEGTHSL